MNKWINGQETVMTKRWRGGERGGGGRGRGKERGRREG